MQHCQCTIPGLGEPQYLGRYSIEKLHLFEEYQRTASPLRVAAVLLLTPVPTLLALIAMDIVPLHDPAAGPRANSIAFVRSTLSHALMASLVLLPIKQALSLSDKEYPFWMIGVIGAMTSLTVEAVCIPLAFYWRFPVPFREMIGLPIFSVSLCLYNYIFARSAMRKLWRRRQLQLYLPIAGVQMVLFYFFLGLSIGFAYLDLVPQIIMILAFPLIKIALKQIVWKYARKLDDISTDVTICMLEISGSLCQTVCFQFVTSPMLNALMIATDVLQALHEVHVYMHLEYLGDGRRTLLTALKIVESSVSHATDRRTTTSTTARSNAETLSVGTTIDDEGPTASASKTGGTAAFARKLIFPLSTSSGNLSETNSMDLATATIRRGTTRTIKGRSVYIERTTVRDRKIKGSRRRRLLDLDQVQLQSSQGRSNDSGKSSANAVANGTVVPVASSMEADEKVFSGFYTDDSVASDAHVHVKSSVRGTHVRQTWPRFFTHVLGALLVTHVLSTRKSTVVVDSRFFQHSQDTHGAKFESPSDAVTQHRSHRARQYALQAGKTTSTSGVPINRRRRIRRFLGAVVIDGLLINRRDQARILEQTLQLLFASEVLLFVEYMEVVIPLLYALLLGGEWGLPNAKYNLMVQSMTHNDVETQIWNALLYALLELVTLMMMYGVLRRKYGMSALYQLSFVLERYWMTLQGKLVGSFIVVLNAATVHQGTDFGLFTY